MQTYRMLTYNMRDLSTIEERIKVQSLLQGLRNPPDLLCSQEHEIRRANLGWLQLLWLAALFISASAMDGVNARQNNHVPVGCGGVFVAIEPRMKGFVTATSIFQPERATWARVDHSTLGNFGVLAVYALALVKEIDPLSRRRSRANTLDSNHNWIIGGDFNMVLAATNRRDGSGRIVVGREKKCGTA